MPNHILQVTFTITHWKFTIDELHAKELLSWLILGWIKGTVVSINPFLRPFNKIEGLINEIIDVHCIFLPRVFWEFAGLGSVWITTGIQYK